MKAPTAFRELISGQPDKPVHYKIRLTRLLLLLALPVILCACGGDSADAKTDFLFEVFTSDKDGRYEAFAACPAGDEAALAQATEAYHSAFKTLTDEKGHNALIANSYLMTFDSRAAKAGAVVTPTGAEYEKIDESANGYSYELTLSVAVHGETREIVSSGQISVNDEGLISAFRPDANRALIGLYEELGN